MCCHCLPIHFGGCGLFDISTHIFLVIMLSRSLLSAVTDIFIKYFGIGDLWGRVYKSWCKHNNFKFKATFRHHINSLSQDLRRYNYT